MRSSVGSGQQQFAKGGQLRPGVWTLVGEQGQELISPSGRVIPADKTRRLMRGGLIPDDKRAIDPGGASGGYTSGPIDPDDTGGAMSLGGIIDPLPPASSSGGGGGGGGGYVAPATTETAGAVAAPAQAAAEAVEAVEQVAVVAAAQAAAGVQQTKAISENIRSQNLANQRQESILQQQLARLQELPSQDEMREIMEESRDTSGF
jgi:hypothetical protein